ncbi:hypothetical protein QBC35DRAFT_540256 [Podospora australis]|uniref:Uncharacterized protein n=1 Tax=Podospora australis TaxID=1536484 RepID=A0AAN6X0T5_9PEZI|nr:hypothetical protein QBC35DRAFT_540256 [Podospora australis]
MADRRVSFPSSSGSSSASRDSNKRRRPSDDDSSDDDDGFEQQRPAKRQRRENVQGPDPEDAPLTPSSLESRGSSRTLSLSPEPEPETEGAGGYRILSPSLRGGDGDDDDGYSRSFRSVSRTLFPEQEEPVAPVSRTASPENFDVGVGDELRSRSQTLSPRPEEPGSPISRPLSPEANLFGSSPAVSRSPSPAPVPVPVSQQEFTLTVETYQLVHPWISVVFPSPAHPSADHPDLVEECYQLTGNLSMAVTQVVLAAANVLECETCEKTLRRMAVWEMEQRYANHPLGTACVPPDWYEWSNRGRLQPARPRQWMKDWVTGEVRKRNLMDNFVEDMDLERRERWVRERREWLGLDWEDGDHISVIEG